MANSPAAHHLEVLVRDMTDQTADECQNRQRLIRGLATLRVVLESKADGAALRVVGRDAVFGQHRPLGVAADKAHSETGVAQTGTDMSVPGDLVDTLQQGVEGG